jgi:hypothetical protein
MYADVIVHPFGEIDEALIGAVRQAVQQRFRVQITIGERKRMPEYSYSQERGQYRSTRFLDELSKVGHYPQIRLGLATVDLFVPELNFVFGEASSEGRIAVFSSAPGSTLLWRAGGPEENNRSGHRRSSARTRARAWIGPLPVTRLCHVVFKHDGRNESKRKCILQEMS